MLKEKLLLRLRLIGAGLMLVLAVAEPAFAQVFSAEDMSVPSQPRAVESEQSIAESPVDEDGNLSTEENVSAGQTSTVALDNNEQDAEAEDIFIPEGELYRLDTPTVDGSVRGGQAFVAVDEKGRMKKADNIFLYYDRFRIDNYQKNFPRCDVRFNILSNLDRKITQLDVKLVWPDMTTTLSFSDVLPNTQTYYNYSLMGKGCYSMDKAPNIVVNRCRVRGMTASECAAKLVWLSR